jgi:hypothetical protein
MPIAITASVTKTQGAEVSTDQFFENHSTVSGDIRLAPKLPNRRKDSLAETFPGGDGFLTRLLLDCLPVELEEMLLTGGERADVDGLSGVDTHPKKRGAIRDGRNDKRAVIFETDKSAIEQVVDARREQQSVFAIQTFVVG